MPSGSSIRRGAQRAEQLGPQLAGILVAARGAKPRRHLATELGVAPATLAELERGEANPTLAYLERVAAGYGVRLALVAEEVANGPM